MRRTKIVMKKKSKAQQRETESISDEIVETGSMDAGTSPRNFMLKKRKRSNFDRQLVTCDSSLRALRKLSGKVVGKTLGSTDGILSNEDFQRIKELQAKKAAKDALTQHGLLRNGSAFKISNTEELSTKRVNPAKFEVHIRRKLSKDEKLALVRAGREDRGKYQAQAAVKQKKTIFFLWFALSGWLFRFLIFATWILPFAGPLLIGTFANSLVIKEKGPNTLSVGTVGGRKDGFDFYKTNIFEEGTCPACSREFSGYKNQIISCTGCGNIVWQPKGQGEHNSRKGSSGSKSQPNVIDVEFEEK